MNNIQLMGIIQQYKYGKATDQDVENAVKEFEADVMKQTAPSQQVEQTADKAMAEYFMRHDYRTMYDYYQKHIKPLLSQQSTDGGWISVQDRTPDEKEEVLTYMPRYASAISVNFILVNGEGTKHWFNTSWLIHKLNDATHWKPLPQPPKTTTK
jgi:hypothetical protein